MKERNLIHIELIRIIAAFLVIFNHTGDKGFFLYSTYEFGGIQFWITLIMSIFCKVAVPLFFMMSGALLLEKEYSLKTIWLNKITKIIFVLVVFSAFYYIRYHLLGLIPEISVKRFFVRLYKGSIQLSFWYLYAYLAMLMSIPFLKSIAKNLSNTTFLYLIGIYFVYISVFPCLEFFLWEGDGSIDSNIRVDWILSNIVLYPIVGYYLENKIDIDKVQRKNIIAIWAISILGLAAACGMTYYKQKITGLLSEADSQAFHNSFILFPCMAIYITIKYICSKVHIPALLYKTISSIGACTFGIYLIHGAILGSKFASKFWNFLENEIHMNRMVMPFLFSFLVFCIGYIITLILKKAPIIRRLI
ncbi:MAG: acyltransferase family protein [Lachnospiraceae bacterium]|nr:acyltransferase family protein [Lachnospiraceae bacterium]